MILCHDFRSAKFVLASTSSRRETIFKKVAPDFRFEKMAPKFKEDLPKNEEFRKYPGKYVRANAMMKAYDVAMRLGDEDNEKVVVIGADTILVSSANVILEKPKDAEDAKRMLHRLSGSTCDAMTGVCIVFFEKNLKDAIVKSFVETTSIQFANLSKDAIDSYVNTKEPLDKAGSIGYQGYGASLIRKINGCYWNVVGLPLHKLCEGLNEVLSSERDHNTSLSNESFFKDIERFSSLLGDRE